MNYGVPQVDSPPLSGPSAASSPRSALARKSSVRPGSLGGRHAALAGGGRHRCRRDPLGRIGNCGELLGAGGLHRHQHRTHDDVRGSGVESRFFGDRCAARSRSQPCRRRRLDRSQEPLTTAYNDAASRPTDVSGRHRPGGQTFTPGARTASSSLLLSSGSVTLNAEGDPDAVFIFQIGSTLITGSNTSVSLINGAQACNVFWQVGSSATLGSGTSFVGTVMAAETHSRYRGDRSRQAPREQSLVNLDTNTITTSNCASSVSGVGGGTETTTPTEALALVKAEVSKPGSPAVSAPTPIGSRTTLTARQRQAKRRAAARRRRHRSSSKAHPTPARRSPPSTVG